MFRVRRDQDRLSGPANLLLVADVDERLPFEYYLNLFVGVRMELSFSARRVKEAAHFDFFAFDGRTFCRRILGCDQFFFHLVQLEKWHSFLLLIGGIADRLPQGNITGRKRSRPRGQPRTTPPWTLASQSTHSLTSPRPGQSFGFWNPGKGIVRYAEVQYLNPAFLSREKFRPVAPGCFYSLHALELFNFL